MLRIVVIGATGTLGQPVVNALAPQHEVVRVGRTRGDYQVDLASRESIERLFAAVGPFDALVATAGAAKFGPLDGLTDADFEFSFANKLMGQVNLVRVGLRSVRDRGSFTLTSGTLAREPVPGSAAISLVNSGLEGFVRAAALEMPRGARVNVVSPPWVSESLEATGRDPAGGMPAAKVAAAYVESLESRRNGEVLDARDFG